MTELKDRPSVHLVDSVFADLCVAYGAPLQSLSFFTLDGKPCFPSKPGDQTEDAKLLSLIPRLKLLEKSWIAAQMSWAKDDAKLDAKLLAETGIPSAQAAWDLIKRKPVSAKAQKLYDQYSEARNRLLARRRKTDPERDKRELKQWDRVRDAAYRLADVALAKPAKTFAGARVQLSAFAMSGAEAFNEHPDETDERHLRVLLESLCSVLAVQPAPMRLRALAAPSDKPAKPRRAAA